jgi:hypothetical protein
MKPIEFNDIKNIYEYEKVREDFRKGVIAAKKSRRIRLGDKMTLVLENRDSVLFQIQEMLRVERIVADEAVQHEINTYNQLVPGDKEISGTLLIDITEKSLIKPVLDSLVGLNNNMFFLRVDTNDIPAVFDEGQSEDDRISAVQYVKWKLSDEDVNIIKDRSKEMSIVCKHPNYSFVYILSPEQHQAVIDDLVS